MKRLFALCVGALAVSLCMTACHDPIFYMINQEVEQEDGLTGDVNSMVKFGDYLYVENGRLYRKSATPSSTTGRYNGQWSRVGTSGLSGFIYALAADGSNLYVATMTFTEDTSDATNVADARRIYASSDGSSFTEIAYPSGVGASTTKGLIYDRTAQKAYAVMGGLGYTLSGTGQPAANTSANGKASAANGQFHSTTAFAYGNGKYYYANDGSTLYYGSSASGGTPVDLGAGRIYAIGVTKDYLLLGTSKGIARVKLDSSGVPAGSTSKFSNNAESMLTSRVDMIFVLDPEKNEGATDEYTNMVVSGYLSSAADTFAENGLYAFYPGRGNWNRDGD